MPKGAPGKPRRPGAGRKPKHPGTTYRSITIRITDRSAAYLDKTGNISAAVDRLVEDKMNYEADASTVDNRVLEIAQAMHAELCACDDKTCETTNEIYSWIASGDHAHLTIDDVPSLINQWREYFAEYEPYDKE